MRIAKEVKMKNKNWTGTARLYKLDPAYMVEEQDYSTDPFTTRRRKVEFVAASAVNAMFSGPETYLFEADENGVVKSWRELPGSFRGSLDQEKAIKGLGYTVKRLPR